MTSKYNDATIMSTIFQSYGLTLKCLTILSYLGSSGYIYRNWLFNTLTYRVGGSIWTVIRPCIYMFSSVHVQCN